MPQADKDSKQRLAFPLTAAALCHIFSTTMTAALLEQQIASFLPKRHTSDHDKRRWSGIFRWR